MSINQFPAGSSTFHFNSRKQNGVGMIEVLVTLGIISIGLLGLGALQITAIQGAADAGNRSQAIWLVNDLANRMQANRTGVINGGYRTNGVNCDQLPRMCTAYHDGDNRIAAQNCLGNQDDGAGGELPDSAGIDIAQSDLYEVACGTPFADSGFNSGIDYLISPTLSVTCLDAPCTATSGYDIRIEWQPSDGSDEIKFYSLRVWP